MKKKTRWPMMNDMEMKKKIKITKKSTG